MFRKKKKFLSHAYEYKVDGEELPQQKKDIKFDKRAFLIGILVSLSLVLLLNFLLNTLIGTIESFISPMEHEPATVLESLFTFRMWELIPLLLLGSGFVTYIVHRRFKVGRGDNIAFGQKGKARLATIEEIQEQYPEIPNKTERFEGVGGIPISHFENNYYIDTNTVNTCILGMSRSGKGEHIIAPLIDILSRAMEQSSMVVNDPKGELYAGSVETLEKRGYEVHVLNIQSPSEGMFFNPLEVAKQLYKEGDKEAASKKVRTVAFAHCGKENAGENDWVYKGATNAVTAMALSLIENSIESGREEQITMANVSEMTTEIGGIFYTESDDDMREQNALDKYFDSLPQGNVAKKRFGSTSLSGEKARGSILSAVLEGLEPYFDNAFAKMTSKNSVDLKDLGFPKSLKAFVGKQYRNRKFRLSFHKNDKKRTKIHETSVKINNRGFFNRDFDCKLSDGDLMLLKFTEEDDDGNVIREYKQIYRLNFEKEKDSNGKVIRRNDEERSIKYKKDVKVTCLVNTFPDVEPTMKVRYSENPTAIFMIIPDYDKSNHTLASIFIKQLYTEIAEYAEVFSQNGKCKRRIHFILDEFGNLPAIESMESILTVCAGRNMLFNLVVQDYNQLKSVYGQASDTIKRNCQNHILIKTTCNDSLKELSEHVGSVTILSGSGKLSSTEEEVSYSSDKMEVLDFNRLFGLMEGETVVIRSMHRRDSKGKKIFPFAIFNTQKTTLPARWEFLGDYIDTSKRLNHMIINNHEEDFELEDLQVDFLDYLVHERARQKYMMSKKGGQRGIQENRRNRDVEIAKKEIANINREMDKALASRNRSRAKRKTANE